MKNRIMLIAGFSVFAVIIYLLMTLSLVPFEIRTELIFAFIDLPSAFIVLVGGSGLAFAKQPKNKNEFFKYFSKTSILVGVIASGVGLINMFGFGMFDDTGMFLANIAMALLVIVYGLIFSGIAYALYKEPN